MTLPMHRFLEVADQIDQLAEALTRSGDAEAARQLTRASALVELQSEEIQDCWGGPLNGQEGRRALVLELLRQIRFDAIVETGTYRGVTTAWLASHFQGPILSCEASYKYLLQAEARLQAYPHVSVTLADSRRFLRDLFEGKTIGGTVLFYLDAHWQEDLPLREELAIIFAQDIRAVVMIDDFQVPDDPGYAYDDYGPGKALTLEILDGLKGAQRAFFFPSLAAEQETGARRGVCVISNDLDEVLATIPGLRGADWDTWKARRSALVEEKNMAELQAARDVVAELVQAQVLELREGMAARLDQLVESLDAVGKAAAAREAAVAGAMQGWTQRLDEFLATADERTQLGREVVDLRAANLDLRRQLHRSESALQQAQQALAEASLAGLRQDPAAGAAETAALPARGTAPGLLPELLEAQAMLASLSRSRALKAIAPLSSGPSSLLDQIREKIGAIIAAEIARQTR